MLLLPLPLPLLLVVMLHHLLWRRRRRCWWLRPSLVIAVASCGQLSLLLPIKLLPTRTPLIISAEPEALLKLAPSALQSVFRPETQWITMWAVTPLFTSTCMLFTIVTRAVFAERDRSLLLRPSCHCFVPLMPAGYQVCIAEFGRAFACCV